MFFHFDIKRNYQDLNQIVNYLYELKPDLLIIDERISPKMKYKSKIGESYAEKITSTTRGIILAISLHIGGFKET